MLISASLRFLAAFTRMVSLSRNWTGRLVSCSFFSFESIADDAEDSPLFFSSLERFFSLVLVFLHQPLFPSELAARFFLFDPIPSFSAAFFSFDLQRELAALSTCNYISRNSPASFFIVSGPYSAGLASTQL